MDPAPIANPHATLVTEGFQGCPPLETQARTRSPDTSSVLELVAGSGGGGIGELATDRQEGHSRDCKVAIALFDGGCEEGNMPSSRRWLPRLAGHRGDLIGQRQQKHVVEDNSRLDCIGGYTLPSLKELGLDTYIEKRN